MYGEFINPFHWLFALHKVLDKGRYSVELYFVLGRSIEIQYKLLDSGRIIVFPCMIVFNVEKGSVACWLGSNFLPPPCCLLSLLIESLTVDALLVEESFIM